MKLVFVYVEEHKVLDKISFITHPLFDVSYIDQKLKVWRKDEKITSYYDGIAIKAIVGKNGCGKSTFLEFIEEGFSYTESSGFMIWLNEDDCSFIIQPVNFDVDSIVFDMCYHYSFRIMDVNFLRKIKHNIVKINNINALPFSMKTKKTNGILDLSLSRQNYFSGNAKNENLRGLITFFNESSWVNNKRATYRYTLNFKKPSSAIKNWVFKIFCNQLPDAKLHFQKKHFAEKYDFIFHPNESSNETFESATEIFQSLLTRNLFSLIRYVLSTNIVDEDYTEGLIVDVLNHIDRYNYIHPFDFLGLIKNAHMKWAENRKSNIITAYDSDIIISNVINVFDTLENIAEIIFKHLRTTGKVISNCSFAINDFEVIVNLLGLFSKLPKHISNNFSYGWNGFSTGELAKMNIFSTIYNYLNRNVSVTNLFIIDEVDLYLHPEWQRTFISEFISFLQNETDVSTIQLLITTHSPLVIGDFLPDDIISLQQDNHGNTYVTESFGFGTEITDAYISGMHISSTFGEHSREKILKLIERKLSNELSDEDNWLISMLKDGSIKRMLKK